MADLSELIEKFEAFLKELEAEGHDVTIKDTKVNSALSNSVRGVMEDDSTPVKQLNRLQKLQTQVSQVISRAYIE